jgi:hypothetical protein
VSATTAIDVRNWIYGFTKGQRIGKGGDSGSSVYNKKNGNFEKTLTEPVMVKLGANPEELPAGTEVVVYRTLAKDKNDKWTYEPDYRLATIFLKENGRTVEQISVRMNGHIVRRRF